MRRDGRGSERDRGGVIRSVRYRAAPPCRLDNQTGRPVPLISCPRIGYVAPRPALAHNQLAASVSARVITAKRYCLTLSSRDPTSFATAPATDLGLYLPCTARQAAAMNRPADVMRGTFVIFSWIARHAVTSPNSAYRFLVRNGNCGGSGGGTYGRITAGERLVRGVVLPNRGCTGITIAVAYNPDLGPGRGHAADTGPGSDGSILVGRRTLSAK